MNLKTVLTESKSEIVRKWSHALRTRTGERYGSRPSKELVALTSEATDANYAVLAHGDVSKIDSFIEKITRLRLSSGFTLSEVQKAFDVYRTILVPILTRSLKVNQLPRALNKVNRCLTYTITKFSDYFQSLHERQMTEYMQNLEQEVIKRTGELSESEAKYRVLVEEMNDGYFVNQNGRIVFANQAFCAMHGHTPGDVLGRSYLDFVAPESATRVQALYEKRLLQEEAPEQYVYYRLHRDGSSLPTENKVTLVKYQGGYASAGVCRDIAERVRMEQRIRESENLAHIGQLTTSLAHEIRNPLSSVKMSIQMALKTDSLDRDNKRTMEISAKEIARLEGILADMLDFAKPLRLRLGPASINEIIESCLEILGAKIREKDILVRKKLSDRIPSALMDSEKIEQAIMNICLNAVEILQRRGSIFIATELESRQPAIRVSISDNGSGVSYDDLPYIFDPFFSKKIKGTGLGLWNVKKIVEAHDGHVTATRKRKGLGLSIVLPLKETHG